MFLTVTVFNLRFHRITSVALNLTIFNRCRESLPIPEAEAGGNNLLCHFFAKKKTKQKNPTSNKRSSIPLGLNVLHGIFNSITYAAI